MAAGHRAQLLATIMTGGDGSLTATATGRGSNRPPYCRRLLKAFLNGVIGHPAVDAGAPRLNK